MRLEGKVAVDDRRRARHRARDRQGIVREGAAVAIADISREGAEAAAAGLGQQGGRAGPIAVNVADPARYRLWWLLSSTRSARSTSSSTMQESAGTRHSSRSGLRSGTGSSASISQERSWLLRPARVRWRREAGARSSTSPRSRGSAAATAGRRMGPRRPALSC